MNRHTWRATAELVDKAYDATCERCGLRRTRAPHSWTYELEWPDGKRRLFVSKMPPCAATEREQA